MKKNNRKKLLITLLSILILFIISIVVGILSSNQIIQTSTKEMVVSSGTVKTKTSNSIDELYDELNNSKTTNLVSDKYLIKDNNISRIKPETTVEEFKSEWENETISIYKDGTEVQDGIIQTGMILKRGLEEYKLIVVGDVKQDGKADQIDVNVLIKEIMENGTEEINTSEAKSFDDLQKIASDINENKKIDKIDIQKVIDNIVFGKFDIDPVEIVKSPKLEIVSGNLGENNWYQTEVQIKVNVQNDLKKTEKTLYKIEGTKTQDFQEIQNEGIIKLNGYGVYKVSAYTIDNNGVKSQVSETIVKVDDRNIVPNIVYSPAKPVDGKVGEDVIATISFNKDDVVVTNNQNSLQHTFKTNGQFVFNFKDKTGRTGSAIAEVTWIGERVGLDAEWKYLVLENGKIQLTRYVGTKTEITVPTEYDGYKVYSIGNPDFDPTKAETRYNVLSSSNSIENTSVTKISFEEGIEIIKGGAFYGCTGLTCNLVLPNSVTIIDTFAFWGCVNLTGDLKIPECVETIGYASFAECKNLNGKLTLPNSLNSIGQAAFGNCSHLNGELIIPNNITRIETNTFNNCAGFGSLKLPDNLTFIGDAAFQYCRNLSGELKIPNSVTSIGKYAFTKCDKLSSLILPTALNSLGDFAFRWCSSLTGNLVLPNSLTNLGKLVFDGCTGLNGELIIPSTLTNVGENTFTGTNFTKRIALIPSSVTTIDIKSIYDFSNINEFKVEAENAVFETENGILYSKDLNTLYAVPVKLSGQVTLHEGLLTIKDGAFSGTGREHSIIIPSSVTEIEEGALEELKELGSSRVSFESESIYEFKSDGSIGKKSE